MDEKVKEKLIGSVQVKPRVSPQSEGDLQTLLTSLSSDEVHIICKGHEPAFQISKSGAEVLLLENGLDVPSDWSGKYLEVDSCSFCSSGFSDPEVKNIPQVM